METLKLSGFSIIIIDVPFYVWMCFSVLLLSSNQNSTNKSKHKPSTMELLKYSVFVPQRDLIAS